MALFVRMLVNFCQRLRHQPKVRLIKWKAHLFTLLSVLWIPFSFFGFSALDAYFNLPIASHALGIGLLLCGLHAVFVGLAIFFWFVEQRDYVETL